MDEARGRGTLRKVAWRLIPLLFLLYVVNILDRINVGIASLQMLPDLHMGEQAYALGAGIFYVGYFVFEVPSNLILRRMGARRWIARILISWGAVTCATMWVKGPWSFCLLRVLLGIAEAGFFPGIIFYLTGWFPARERARAVALFMIGSQVTGIVGNPLSGAILQYMNDFAGLRGWQWVFLLEGLPAVLLGFVVLYCLPDRPEQARWLTPEERDWLAARVGAEEEHRAQHHGLTLRQSLTDGRVWLLCALYFSLAASASCLAFYTPKLIQNSNPSLTEFQIGLLAAIPSVCAVVGMLLVGMHSDRTGERRWHVAVPAFVGVIGWLLSVWLKSPVGLLVGLALAQAGTMSAVPVFWSLPTAFLSGAAAAAGIAWINSVGNLGGYGGPQLFGKFHDPTTDDFSLGQIAMAIVLGAGVALVLCGRHNPAAEAHTS
ncbi:MAG: MFS transporter [Planctomycetes bacterium]|nr:MFS transporter [Planctomycetota bacterium]